MTRASVARKLEATFISRHWWPVPGPPMARPCFPDTPSKCLLSAPPFSCFLIPEAFLCLPSNPQKSLFREWNLVSDPTAEDPGSSDSNYTAQYFLVFFPFLFFFFLGPCLPHMEASRLGVELELQLLACATGQGWSPCPHGWILVKVVTAEPQGELLRPNINVRSRFPLTFLPHRPTLHPWMYFCHFLFQLYVVNLCSTLSDSVTPMQPSKLSSMVLFTMFPQRGWVYSLLLEYVLVYTLHRVLTDYHLTFVFLSIYIFICIIYVLLYMYTICIIYI